MTVDSLAGSEKKVSELNFSEPAVIDPEGWFGRVGSVGANLICTAEMQWSQHSLWKIVVAARRERGSVVEARDVRTGLDVFREVVSDRGEVDVVTALQVADYYSLIMLSQRGYSMRTLELSVEATGTDLLQSEDSATDGTYSALATGYYSAFTRDDLSGRSQLMAMASSREVGGALALLFVLAHTDVAGDVAE